ncbi:MAG TPA: hypothetical protein EYG67_02245 [Campylobacterales bacterium]|nr:hypothetical protein [Campylobacterales bacterium]HIP41012.1 hypothetical protein [Campylobacterales bacterium]
MKLAQYLYTENGWNKELDGLLDTPHTLIIIFAPSNTSKIKIRLKEIAQQFPLSQIIGCSSAGDIPQGHSVTLMKANFNQLIYGASQSAKSMQIKKSKIAPLSCIGRKLVLENLPAHTLQIGYYSYGEY